MSAVDTVFVALGRRAIKTVVVNRTIEGLGCSLQCLD